MNARSRLLALVLSISFLAICSSAFSQNEGTDEAADLMRTDHIYKYSNGPNPEDTYYVVRMTDGTLTFYTGPAHNIFEIINRRGSEYKRPKVTIKDGGLYFRDVGAFGRLNARIINSNSIIPGYSGLVIQYHYDTKHISSFALTGEHAIYYRNLADKHQQALVAEADRKAMQEEEERAAESRKKAEQTAAEQNTFFAKLISGRLSEALAMLLGDQFCAWMAAGAIFLAIANYPPWRVIKPDLHQGQVIQWNDARGFGFISPQDSSGKVFFHASSLQDRKNPPNAGSTVYYVAGQPKPGNNHDDDDDESERHLEARIVTYQTWTPYFGQKTALP